jgi:hypothetical protein
MHSQIEYPAQVSKILVSYWCATFSGAAGRFRAGARS